MGAWTAPPPGWGSIGSWSRAARSPIGRAFKGSLKDIRPDDLLAQIVRAALEKVPALDPKTIEDVYAGAADNSECR